MKAVIFGINGQDGFYLYKLLNQQTIKVIGVSRTPNDNVKQGDIKDFSFVELLIKTEQPDYIFNLAANSTTQHSALFENHETISTGTLNILESVYKHSKHSKVFLSGSAVQFENNGLPIDENTPFAPLSPYAVSRIQSVYAGRYYRNLGLQVYIGYFFNHDSPLRTERHVNQKIAMAANRVANGSKEKIEIGNINVQKEYNFAGDMMQAIWLRVNQNRIFEAVIGSGKAFTIRDWINACFNIIHKDWNEYVIEKNNFIPEYNILISNPTIIKSIGYSPKVDLNGLAKMMINTK
jgi:GDPmannose 4,6-dehydratase